MSWCEGVHEATVSAGGSTEQSYINRLIFSWAVNREPVAVGQRCPSIP